MAIKPIPWIDALEVGSIIRRGPNGPPRVVRAVHKRDGFVYSVTLVIRRCSWTKRAYTSMNRYDLTWNGYEVVPRVKAKLNTEFDQTMDRVIRKSLRSVLTCCDVHGLP